MFAAQVLKLVQLKNHYVLRSAAAATRSTLVLTKLSTPKVESTNSRKNSARKLARRNKLIAYLDFLLAKAYRFKLLNSFIFVQCEFYSKFCNPINNQSYT